MPAQFHVGDEVKIIGNRHYHSFQLGSRGKIVKCYTSEDYRGCYEIEQDTRHQTMNIEDLRLVKTRKPRIKKSGITKWLEKYPVKY